MALVCEEHKFIYFLAPGTGSTSLYRYLPENFNIKRIPDSHDNIVLEGGKKVIQAKHSTFKELKNNNFLSEEQCNYLRITGVRNPYDYLYAEWYRSRTVFSKDLGDESSWIYKTPAGKQRIKAIVNSLLLEFPDWLEKRLQDRYDQNKKVMLHPEYVNHADAFIRMEHMNKDLHDILHQHCGIDKKIDVEKKNVTSRNRCYWQHYSRPARKMVESVFEPYLEKFKYVF